MKKRIALAAAAALAGGLLVAAPASALTSPEVDELASGTVTWTGAVTAGPSNFVFVTAVETTTPAMQGARIEIVGSTILAVTDDVTDSLTASQVSSTVALVGNKDSIKVAVTAAGTITANVYWATGVGTFSSTAEVATYVVPGAVAPEVYHHAGVSTTVAAGANSIVDSNGVLYAPKGTVNSPAAVGTFVVSQYATETTTLISNTDLTKEIKVEISGVGLISKGDETYTTNLSWAAKGAAQRTVTILNDGRAGAASTIKVTVGTEVFTKTVIFYGTAKATGLALSNSYLGIGDTATLTGLAKDENGNLVPVLSGLTVASDSTTIATIGAFAENDSTTVGRIKSVVTAAAKGTVKFSVGNGVETPTVSAQVVKAGVDTITATVDTTTPKVGDKLTFTVSAVNADGVLPADTSVAVSFSSTTSLIGLLDTTSLKFVGGKATFTAYAPLAGGPVTVTVKVGTQTSAVVLDVKDPVADAIAKQIADLAAAQAAAAKAAADAAAAAAAAQAAADAKAAAQAAAVSALQTNLATLTTTVASLVASMTAQIKVINATLLKIQKAVAALRTQVNKL